MVTKQGWLSSAYLMLTKKECWLRSADKEMLTKQCLHKHAIMWEKLTKQQLHKPAKVDKNTILSVPAALIIILVSSAD